MKDKKYKYLEDLFEEYIQLRDEQTEIPALIEKAQKKFSQHLAEGTDVVYKFSDAEDLYKLHTSLKKQEERKQEIEQELAEVEEVVKGFLQSLKGGKISFDKKDDDKSKVTYVFFLDGEQVKCAR